MWLGPLAQLLVAATLLGQTPPAAPTATSDPIATRQTTFAIPFRVDRAEDSTRQPVEVQLYVSTDRGAHWQLYAKAPTTQQSFLFRAGGNGEFWFAIRTVDRSGQMRPETIPGPALRVIVDATPPVMRLSADLIQAGQVVVRWEIDEPNIKPNSLKLQYRVSEGEPWQPVALESMSSTESGTTNRGEVTFWPKPGANEIQLRADALDTAGNTATASAALKMDQNIAPRPGVASVRPHGPTADDSVAAQGAFNSSEPKGSVAIAISPAIGSRFVASNNQAVNAPKIPGLPPGERPRMVNSRLFELDYDVDSVGSSGIGRVELWGTRDAGATWRSFTVDNDNRSPLLVNVDDEGIFGFCVVVTNGAGLGGKSPERGDLPDLWVGVDFTKPTARIVAAQQGVNSEAGYLIISWQADDKMLAPRPVSLSFSQSRTGPWLPVASGLENSGRYAWPIDNRTPSRFYLRLEVRDEAGNIGTHQTPDPITIDQSRPTIRVRDIRPVGQTSARPVRRS